MAMTQAELEAQYVQAQQAEARQVVALVNAVVDNKISLQEVDLDALAAKVTRINNYFDGNSDLEGFQNFEAILSRLETVEGASTAQAQSIATLQTALNSAISTLNTRIGTVESEARTAREALDTRISGAEGRVTALETAKTGQDTRLATLEGKVSANETALTGHASALSGEVARAQAAEQGLRDEIVTERGRIDSLVSDSGAYATRSNVAAASTSGSMAFANALWAAAGIAMPAGLPMPDGTTSA